MVVKSEGVMLARLVLATGLQLLPFAVISQELRPVDEVRVYAEQLRMSTFADGLLLDNSQSKINHQDVNPRALSLGSVHGTWAFARWPGWTAEVFVKQETRISGADGTLVAVASLNGDRVAKGAGVGLPFSINAQTMRRIGIGLGHNFVADLPGNPRLSVMGRGFVVDKYRSVTADGVVTEAFNGNLGIQASTLDNRLGGDSDYIHPIKVVGLGFAMDLSSLWGNSDADHLLLEARNIGPSVRIKHVLQTTKNINTNTVSYDANGFIQFAPIVNGRYSDVSTSARQYPQFVVSGAQKIGTTVSALLRVNSSYPSLISASDCKVVLPTTPCRQCYTVVMDCRCR